MSGPTATMAFLAQPVIDIVQDQVKQQGGINVGGVMRPLQIVSYDMEGTTSGATKAARLAILQDHVTAVLWGGFAAGGGEAISDVAQANNTLYSNYFTDPQLITNYTVTMSPMPSLQDASRDSAKFTLDKLQPKTAAYLTLDDPMYRQWSASVQKTLEAAGVKTVYNEYHDYTVTDFTPYLTKIKYSAPDVLVGNLSTEGFMNVMKQIPGLGGWGNIKLVGLNQASTGGYVTQFPASDGQYGTAYWAPGSTEPGPKAFEDAWHNYAIAHPDWAKKYGNLPDQNDVPFYQPLWLAIKAIEMAGTDDLATVVKAARSGNLVWNDSPMGSLHVATNGTAGARNIEVQMMGGKIVPIVRYTN